MQTFNGALAAYNHMLEVWGQADVSCIYMLQPKLVQPALAAYTAGTWVIIDDQCQLSAAEQAVLTNVDNALDLMPYHWDTLVEWDSSPNPKTGEDYGYGMVHTQPNVGPYATVISIGVAGCSGAGAMGPYLVRIA